MLRIFDFEIARETILRRCGLTQVSVSNAVQARLERLFGSGTTPASAVANILSSIQTDGDRALRRWSQALDGFETTQFRVSSQELASAARGLEPQLLSALELSIERVRSFHRQQPLNSWMTEDLGGRLGHKITPIRRVGVYVPGGSAPLTSSLVMSVIPAQVAGVDEIAVCTPPRPSASILAAAQLCGVTEIYQLGGAQAIAALAYGTESIPRVDKIVGPGNLFVTLAKQQVYGLVGLDGLAGPTETVIIADGSAEPARVAADLLAQAEHDPLAAAILLTPDRSLAEAVQAQVARQIEDLSRAEIITQALDGQSGIVITPDLATAAALANDYAPEHLCLVVADPEVWTEKINNAGAIFLGPYSFEVLGDYVAGPNHVLPTGGTARFSSCLNVMDFVKLTAVINLDRETSRHLSDPAARLAREESLTAHAAAAESRWEEAL